MTTLKQMKKVHGEDFENQTFEVVLNTNGHGFHEGETVTFLKADQDGDVLMQNAQGKDWYVRPEDMEKV